MLNPQEIENIYKINAYTYEQYNGVWCKALAIIDEKAAHYDASNELHQYYSVKGYEHEQTDQLVRQYLADPTALENCLQLIQVFLEDHLIEFTPESFCYNYTLRESNWQLIDRPTATSIVDAILDRSKAFLAQARAEAKAEVLEYLNYFDCPSLEAYEASSPAKKAKINLTQFYQDYGFTPDGAPRIDFEAAEHEVLKQHFLQDLFDASTVRFFSSLTLDQLDHAFETEQQMAAVVAMDGKKMALLWFNY